jgi:hypothetical protein
MKADTKKPTLAGVTPRGAFILVEGTWAKTGEAALYRAGTADVTVEKARELASRDLRNEDFTY